MHFQILLAIVAMSSLGPASAQDRSQCKSSCGNVTIAYPFGEEGCYYNSDFNVTCDRLDDPPKAYYGNAVVTNISISASEMEIMMSIANDCYDSFGNNTYNKPYLKLRSFRISTKNRFVAVGCDTYAYIVGTRGNESDGTGCSSICGRNSQITNGSCSGVGCCEISIPEGISSFNLSALSYNNHADLLGFNPCSRAFVVNEEKFNFSSSHLLNFENDMPMLLDWAIGNETCKTVNKADPGFLCKGNSDCDKNYTGPGYRCRCLDGYKGNAYIPNKCTNIDECANPDHGCLHHCADAPGTYTCSCRRGYTGDGKKGGTGCTPDQSLIIMIAICAVTAIILLLLLVSWVYLGVQKHKSMILRDQFFKKNGGIMLQQRISGDESSHTREKVHFTAYELKKATNNYNESMIIGRGGYGTVFKGILSDNRIVAIKKSKLTDQSQAQIEQFINEVVILSQINHRNVVKLIGCCLETEVPSLVYEFIPNGTLSDHIHNECKSLAFTWNIRLRIATETAGALSYLHSAASVPIVHRDIKPMNILLDDNYVAKVADFGASRLIPADQIELATMVQGTLGYLDPEYLQNNQLTDKSDVYSFGVVLIELITGKQAIGFDRPEKERSLAMYFLSSLKEGRLFQVLDEHLQLNEVPNEITQVSSLAERCICVKGEERPTMKEVAIELEGILASMIHKHPWVQSSSNEDEGLHLLKQTTDDYEYTDGANGSSRTFDSMSKQAVLPTARGR